MMKVCLTLIVLAVALLDVLEARRLSRRNELVGGPLLVGGWRDISPSDVPDEVVQHATERISSTFNGYERVKMTGVTSAKEQTVRGTNYELKLSFQLSNCASSESVGDDNDGEACETQHSSCTVKVNHTPWLNSIDVFNYSCIL